MEKSKNLEDYFIIQDGKKLHYGYTTGSCAAAATKVAALMLFEQKAVPYVSLMTPKGILLHLQVEDISIEKTWVSCAIRKDGGDDPDATHGILIYARVELKEEKKISLRGGKGVGIVTKKGLEQEVGQAAINKVPRRMIKENLVKICRKYGYEGGMEVTISVPEGEEIAKKTFNPRLGIEGGISILGTSGIVVPMSEEALLKTIEIEINMQISQGFKYLLISPGNYGESYIKEHMDIDFSRIVKCSNFIGKTIDMAVNAKAEGILFISHIGKFIKVSGGIMDTHSKSGDCRAELLAAHAIRCGADIETAKRMLSCLTTDDALEVLKEADAGGKLMRETMREMAEKIDFYLHNRCKGQISLGAVIFSNIYGYLAETKKVPYLLEEIEKREREENYGR